MDLWPGRPFPLGATPTDTGTNFAVASDIALGIELCLFDEAGAEQRVSLVEQDAGIWHGFVPAIGPGQRYGYRVSGPYQPRLGLRCNSNKLLLDPYARAIVGDVTWGTEVLSYPPGDPDGFSSLDSAPFVPRGLVISGEFEWGEDAPPVIPYSDTIVYETHVKGFTQRHPGIPPQLRGTFAGLAHPAVVEHLTRLGVTAVELLPVHHHLDESSLRAKGLDNYWGYSTLGFFAPHAGYSAEVRAGHPGGQVAEFKSMVKVLHAAGLEVILDVVFNHTPEGNHLGPTLSFRGFDNPAYYRLVESDQRYYFDTTGTGNTLNADAPLALRLIMDSLRYWITEMHVDGFRFDLAVALAREHGGFDRVSAFFDLMAQDPVVSRVKLIAEPWDVGQSDSYDLGRFPALWSEWNGRYRDTVRDFWRGLEGTLLDLATRLTGSADLYGPSRRRPNASVNFVTCHDGFTLRDLVSYDAKHNEANGEANNDGTDDNRSWNCGAEGPTDDPAVRDLRITQSRALLATVLLSLGVPMLQGGDEMGRTQQGNNNAYCQDNEISWFDWTSLDADLLNFAREVVAIRRRHPVLRRRRFVGGAGAGDVQWFTPVGSAMTEADWNAGWTRSVVMYADGKRDPDRDERGRPILDDDLLLLINGWWEPLTFTLPDVGAPRTWERELDTFDGTAGEGHGGPAGGVTQLRSGSDVTLGPRSLVLLKAASPA
ncbi:MAG TPA: glycogen debranching protein GlgX [Candidatus Limnocylindrales bacterium]